MAEAAAEHAHAQDGEFFTFCLPPLAMDDPLLAEKKKIMDARELHFKFLLPLHSSDEEVLRLVNQMVQTARVVCMNEIELYFAGEDGVGPFSPRNELESLNLLLENAYSFISNAKDGVVKVLHLLRDTTVAMIKSLCDSDTDKMTVKMFGADSEELLMAWAKNHGVKTMLKIDYFEEAGRGAVAVEDMNIGDIALEIPELLIIAEDLVYESDMFNVLKYLDGISPDTMLLLWSMRERFNPNSKFKIYFDTLPEEFNTGLSFGVNALAALEGTLLFEELLQSREHLHNQYDGLFPALCDSYPKIFQRELYSWDKFLWACELWYSNSMKVVFADGKLRTCLVPVAGFLNHSLCPHILHYGRVDLATKSLKFPLSRPCGKGNQCYLSYGGNGLVIIASVGFRVLMCLESFVVTNLAILIDFDAPDGGSGNQPLNGANGSDTTHMVRGTWLSNCNKRHSYGLPSKLLAHLRAIVKAEDTELDPPGISRKDIDKENERNVLETILSIFVPMLEGLSNSDNFDRKNLTWDVKLSLGYRDLQSKIISSIIKSCNSGLQLLDDM